MFGFFPVPYTKDHANAWKVIQPSSRNRYWHSSKLPKATWIFPALRVGIGMPLFRRFLGKRA
jgi:hypothetical protein